MLGVRNIVDQVVSVTDKKQNQLNQIKEFINSQTFSEIAPLVAHAINLGYLSFDGLAYPDEISKALRRMRKVAKRETHKIVKACNAAISSGFVSFDGIVTKDNVELFFKSALKQLGDGSGGGMGRIANMLLSSGYNSEFKPISDEFILKVKKKLIEMMLSNG
jgi:hypothetical protein